MSKTTIPPTSLPHIILFPFLSKGHTIPLIQLAHLLHRRRLATVTFLTTPLNVPFLRTSLGSTPATILDLPFPDNVPGVPPGIESTDQLPSMSFFLPFVSALKLLQPHLDGAIRTLHPPATLLVSDGFLAWTLDSARCLGIPRLVFTGMSMFAQTVSAVVWMTGAAADVTSNTEQFSVPALRHLKMTMAEINVPFDRKDAEHEPGHFEFRSMRESHGYLMLGFYEMDAFYADYWKEHICPNTWLLGPLCLAEPAGDRPYPLELGVSSWLDQKAVDNRPVLYVAFGTQAGISMEQLKEIAAGLEASGVDFLWVVKSKSSPDQSSFHFDREFEERVAGRGLVAKTWVAQREVLRHESVKGFMSHCGWNSVMESVCAGVPIAAWPMMAEQPMNARYVVEELKVGVRVPGSGEKGRVVARESVAEAARGLLVGERAEEMREKAEDLAAAARESMEEGGSSWRSLEAMVSEVAGGGNGRT